MSTLNWKELNLQCGPKHVISRPRMLNQNPCKWMGTLHGCLRVCPVMSVSGKAQLKRTGSQFLTPQLLLILTLHFVKGKMEHKLLKLSQNSATYWDKMC